MWFTENPWPGVLLFSIIGLYFLIRAAQSGLARNWVMTVVFLLSAGAAYYVEWVIITPAEEVEMAVFELLDDCKAGNAQEVLEKISNTNLLLKTVIGSGMAMAKIHDDVRLTDLQVKTMAQDSRAVSHFRANGTVSVNNMSYSGHASTRWEVTWQKEEGQWKIVSVKRLNPINGQEMGILDQSGN